MKFEMNGIDWTVYRVPSNSDMLRRSDNTVTVGMCDFPKRAIFLSDKLRGGFLRKVFIHEVCHSAVFSHGIYIDEEQEEFLCNFVAEYGDRIFGVVDGMFGVLRKAYIA